VRILTLSLAAAVLAGAATPALANDSDIAFNSFNKVCGATAAEYPAVVAAADGDGWQNTPVIGDNSMPKVSVTDKAARKKVVGAQNLVLVTSRGLAQTPNGPLTVSDCTMHSDTGDLAAVEARLQTWLGFAPTSTAADRATYRFTTDGSAIKAVTDANANDAVAGAGLQVLTVSRNGGSLTVDLLKIKK
jgi:hypothetical protein